MMTRSAVRGTRLGLSFNPNLIQQLTVVENTEFRSVQDAGGRVARGAEQPRGSGLADRLEQNRLVTNASSPSPAPWSTIRWSCRRTIS